MASFSKRRERDPAVAARLPPGQELTTKWPVLHYGSVPRVDLATWDFHVTGLVEQPVRFTWDEFMALPQTRRYNDVHCVTRWSKLDNEWEGVAVLELMNRVTLRPEARAVLVHAEQGFTANLLLEDFLREENLFAHCHDGRPLEPEHGYPLRLVVPHLYGDLLALNRHAPAAIDALIGRLAALRTAVQDGPDAVTAIFAAAREELGPHGPALAAEGARALGEE